MQEIFDTYVENTFGAKEQAVFKFKQYEYNYKKYFPVNKDAYVLDIGIGRGEMLTCMQKWNYKNYHGIDISSSTVKYCQSLNLNCELVDNTPDWLNSHPAKYDVITLFDVLEHIKKDQTFDFLKAVKNALSANGVLIVQVPNMQALDSYLHRFNDFTHETGFTENSLNQVLTSLGFKNIEFSGFEENTSGGIRGIKRAIYRSLIWKCTRFKRRMTGNLNPKILHPVLFATAKK